MLGVGVRAGGCGYGALPFRLVAARRIAISSSVRLVRRADECLTLERRGGSTTAAPTALRCDAVRSPTDSSGQWRSAAGSLFLFIRRRIDRAISANQTKHNNTRKQPNAHGKHTVASVESNP